MNEINNDDYMKIYYSTCYWTIGYQLSLLLRLGLVFQETLICYKSLEL